MHNARVLTVGSATELIALRFELGLQAQALGSQFGGTLVVSHLRCCPFLVFEMAQAVLRVLEVSGQHLRVYAELARSLVYEVNRLVGQQPVRYVARAQADGSGEGIVLDTQLVVRLVARAQSLQHLDCRLLVRLLHQNRLEAAFESGVALDVLAVLVLSGRAHRLEFAASESRLHHVAGIDRAL